MSAERIRSQVQENTSGQGKGTELPDELKGLNWGAFLFNWIWGLFNKTYIALLTLIPFVNFVMVFVLLFKGNQWAWANKSWDDYDHFRRVQRRWAWAALIFFILVLLASVGGAISVPAVMKESEPYKMGHEKLLQHPEAVKILGKPIEGSWWVSGNYEVSGPSGTAEIAQSVSGPNDEGTLYISAVQKAGRWRLTQLVLDTNKAGKRINLLTEPAYEDLKKATKLYDEEKYDAALGIFRKLAEQNNPVALNNIGAMYESGKGVAKDDAEAAKWFLRAAEAGFSKAQFNIGLRYKSGQGVRLDDKEAVKWYLRAAAQGFVPAMNNMGVMYVDGRGVAKDIVTAYMWFTLSQQKGYKPAKKALDYFAKEMTPEQIAQAEGMAKAWTPENMSPAKQAAKAEAEPAAKAEAKPDAKPAMKENGKPNLAAIRAGAGRGDKKAISQLKVLAAKGNAEAQILLGDLYLTGKGVFKNGSLAGTWYQSAAEKGNAEGQYKIAIIYLNGVYLPLDPKEAVKWLKKAAQQGHAGAQETLMIWLGETPPPVMKPKK